MGREALRAVSFATIARARQVQRGRLLVMAAGMWVLLRLPRFEALAQMMLQRWHVEAPAQAAAPVS